MSDWFGGRRGGGFVPSFEALQNEVNRVFADFGFTPPTQPPSPTGAGPVVSSPRLDVLKTRDGDYEIHAELPGLEEKDIDLSVDGNILTLSGERRVDRDAARGEWRVRERSHGAFARTIALPFEAKPEDIDAEFKNGVLMVRVQRPREPERSGSKVPIRSASSAGGGQGEGGFSTPESTAGLTGASSDAHGGSSGGAADGGGAQRSGGEGTMGEGV